MLSNDETSPEYCQIWGASAPYGVIGAGWSSPVARQAHNLKVVGSNPTPATTTIEQAAEGRPFAFPT